MCVWQHRGDAFSPCTDAFPSRLSAFTHEDDFHAIYGVQCGSVLLLRDRDEGLPRARWHGMHTQEAQTI